MTDKNSDIKQTYFKYWTNDYYYCKIAILEF